MNASPRTMNKNKLIDTCNRHLNYLRVSITDRCNLRCLYCVPHDRIPKLTHDEILTYEEILRIIGIGVELGITKVRVTGGEPLVRKGVYDFLQNLRGIGGITDVSLTTNAVLLKDNVERILAAGVRRLNISLDTLNPEKYREITGINVFDRVWEGIEKAGSLGIAPIKINAVALKGYNDDELVDLARLSLDRPFHIRFIEYMPIGMSHINPSGHLLTPEIKSRVAQLGALEPVERDENDGPAERFKLKGARGEIGFISAMSHHFCRTCNRLRLTANGKLRACLLSDQRVDVIKPLRRGCSDADIARLFMAAVRKKPSQHRLDPSINRTIDGQMCSIGG